MRYAWELYVCIIVVSPVGGYHSVTAAKHDAHMGNKQMKRDKEYDISGRLNHPISNSDRQL